MTITIGPATLGGAAAAARLAKLGHQVQLVGAPGEVGGHWVNDLPPVITLPATWRDLFRKSGRALDAELTRAGLALDDAPSALHRFPDGLELDLPAERGAQFAAISSTLGTPAAERWRDLLDEVDEVWLALRHAGVEEPRPPKPAKDLATRLMRTTTLTDLAERVAEPHLAQIIAALGPRSGTDSPTAPALLATRLVIERTFGRWHLIISDGTPVPATRLLELLTERLHLRKVTFTEDAAPDLDLTRTIPRRTLFGPRLRPALAPRVSHHTDDITREVIDHTPAGPIVSWPGIRHDFTATTPDLAWGFAPDNWPTWWARPDTASAGNEPWAELANAALLVYDYHAATTGADVRPSNKAYRP